MIRRPPRSTRTDTRFPYTTLFRSGHHPLDTCDQVHGAAHPLDELSANRPIREIAVPGDLHCAQNPQIDMPAADHRETIGGAEKARRRKSSNRLLSFVDQNTIYLIVIGDGPDAEHPVF